MNKCTCRSPFHWDKVGSDVLDEDVALLLRSYREAGYAIILVSGRDGCCRKETEAWLAENEVNYSELFMREAGDTRKDTIIKEEIFWRDIAPYYNVQAVVDDRPCVCRMWRDVEIPKVIQVGDPHTEF